MYIAGLQKMTLIDFPGKVAATVFTRGCPFRCSFCHNPELVLPIFFDKQSLITEEELFKFLETRYGKLEGICITGGEPLMQKDIEQFIPHLKALGFSVKLDTNGYYPTKLERLIKKGDLDYIAMDIKNSLVKYAQTIGAKTKELEKKIKESITLIMNSGIPYEFRTTAAKPLHSARDFEGIGELINGASKYFIQNYVKTKQINKDLELEPFAEEELVEAKKIIKKFVTEVGIR